MEQKTISKKVPIALAICWLAFVVCSYIAVMVMTIVRPDLYIRMVTEDTLLFMMMLCTSVLAAAFMLPIHFLSKRASIKWLAIVSLVHLALDILFAIMAMIISMTLIW